MWGWIGCYSIAKARYNQTSPWWKSRWWGADDYEDDDDADDNDYENDPDDGDDDENEDDDDDQERGCIETAKARYNQNSSSCASIKDGAGF